MRRRQQLPYFRLFPADYRERLEYRKLDRRAKGLLLDMLLEYWTSGSLPLDAAILAIALNTNEDEIRELLPTLKPFMRWNSKRGTISFPSLDEDYREGCKRVADAKRAARERWGKDEIKKEPNEPIRKSDKKLNACGGISDRKCHGNALLFSSLQSSPEGSTDKNVVRTTESPTGSSAASDPAPGAAAPDTHDDGCLRKLEQPDSGKVYDQEDLENDPRKEFLERHAGELGGNNNDGFYLEVRTKGFTLECLEKALERTLARRGSARNPFGLFVTEVRRGGGNGKGAQAPPTTPRAAWYERAHIDERVAEDLFRDAAGGESSHAWLYLLERLDDIARSFPPEKRSLLAKCLADAPPCAGLELGYSMAFREACREVDREGEQCAAQ